eukprot:g6835.t1
MGRMLGDGRGARISNHRRGAADVPRFDIAVDTAHMTGNAAIGAVGVKDRHAADGVGSRSDVGNFCRSRMLTRSVQNGCRGRRVAFSSSRSFGVTLNCTSRGLFLVPLRGVVKVVLVKHGPLIPRPRGTGGEDRDVLVRRTRFSLSSHIVLVSLISFTFSELRRDRGSVAVIFAPGRTGAKKLRAVPGTTMMPRTGCPYLM